MPIELAPPGSARSLSEYRKPDVLARLKLDIGANRRYRDMDGIAIGIVIDQLS